MFFVITWTEQIYLAGAGGAEALFVLQKLEKWSKKNQKMLPSVAFFDSFHQQFRVFIIFQDIFTVEDLTNAVTQLLERRFFKN